MSQIAVRGAIRNHRSRIAALVAAAGCIALLPSGTASAAETTAGPPAGSSAFALDAPSALTGTASVVACPAGHFCLYPAASYGGAPWIASETQKRWPLSPSDFNDRDMSWINNRAGDVRVYNDWTNGHVAGIYFDARAHTREAIIRSSYNRKGSGVALYP